MLNVQEYGVHLIKEKKDQLLGPLHFSLSSQIFQALRMVQLIIKECNHQ